MDYVSAFVPILSVLIACGALIYTVKNSKREDKKEIIDRATADAKVNVKLDSISSTLTDIKYDISSTKKEVATLTERICTVESSVKSAHHRLDGLERRGKDNE